MPHDRDVGLKRPLFGASDRDFRFLVGSCDIEPRSATPKATRMLDFNLWAWNSRIAPGTDGGPRMIHRDHKENDVKTLPPRTPTRRAAIQGLAGTAAIATLPALLLPAARAHTGQPHAREPGPVRKEQKDWGIAGEAKKARRTIEVGMADSMRFSPDRIDVRLGETVRFLVRNRGRVLHEFVIGTPAENARHAELMLKFPDMEHDEPYMAHVAPGKTGQIVWTFNRAGEFEFACLIAGHYQAGMVGSIRVVAAG